MTKTCTVNLIWDMQADEMAGLSVNLIHDGDNEQFNRRWGFIADLGVRKLLRALLARSFRLLKGRGMTAVSLGVDSDNTTGALRLYEGVGFDLNNRFTVYQKPLTAG